MACEVLATAGKILVAGEITTKEMPDIPHIVCKTVRETGYDSNYEVEVTTHDQSMDIASAVGHTIAIGAGDQGIMYGYACHETKELLPLPVVLAHRITKRLTVVRLQRKAAVPSVRRKSQVSVEYKTASPIGWPLWWCPASMKQMWAWRNCEKLFGNRSLARSFPTSRWMRIQ